MNNDQGTLEASTPQNCFFLMQWDYFVTSFIKCSALVIETTSIPGPTFIVQL